LDQLTHGGALADGVERVTLSRTAGKPSEINNEIVSPVWPNPIGSQSQSGIIRLQNEARVPTENLEVPEELHKSNERLSPSARVSTGEIEQQGRRRSNSFIIDSSEMDIPVTVEAEEEYEKTIKLTSYVNYAFSQPLGRPWVPEEAAGLVAKEGFEGRILRGEENIEDLGVNRNGVDIDGNVEEEEAVINPVEPLAAVSDLKSEESSLQNLERHVDDHEDIRSMRSRSQEVLLHK